MHAVVRVNSFDPVKLTDSPALEQFDQIHRAQPGYVGTIVVDLHAGRRLVLNLWESEEHSGNVVRRRARSRPAPRTADVPPF